MIAYEYMHVNMYSLTSKDTNVMLYHPKQATRENLWTNLILWEVMLPYFRAIQ